ncbi:MAG: hypothetical protein J0L87_10935 [Bacteroidetes bacterium]|nr:hypothetical protein [Bacteroidota bacterium]
MKKAVHLSVLSSLIAMSSIVAQSAKEQAATDACPSWSSKKKMNSSGVYIPESSKKAANKELNNFSSPKYQYLFAYKPAAKAAEHSQTQSTVKRSTAKTQARSVAVAEQKKEEPVKAIPMITPVVVTEKEEQKVAPASGVAKASEEKAQAASTEKKEKKVLKTTRVKKHWFKNIKLRRKKAADCPDF